MKNVKSIISIIGIIVKYGAIVTAVIKGIQVVYTELEKIEVDDKTPVANE